jgi:hypothetical protein
MVCGCELTMDLLEFVDNIAVDRNQLLLLFYSAMYSVFIPVGPLPLSGASVLVPRFAPSGAEPMPMPSWAAPAIPIATLRVVPG